MNLGLLQFESIAAGAGSSAHSLITELYPFCRSITGKGVRKTLEVVGKLIPLALSEVPTGTPVFDWTVPREWNISEAYIATTRGERIVDFARHNLHVLNYSIPVRKRVSLSELKSHLFSLPDHPDWIPYRTSYYREEWGFCVPHRLLETLNEAEYDVVIDSKLTEGSLTYGECYLPGELKDEIFVSCHICHPSLCNDNLSGISVAVELAKWIASNPHKYSYRFLFAPGTIGAITWLATHELETADIRHGLVLTGVGDRGSATYKKSRVGESEIDRAMSYVVKNCGTIGSVVDFEPWGYDERQYCSPGFNLPVGCLMRTRHGTYPEYHTSADNLEFVVPESLSDTIRKCMLAFAILENNGRFENLNPKCEPQLGKRGLYRAIGGTDAAKKEKAMLWVLNLSDGKHSLLDIAERSNISFELICEAADQLERSELLRRCERAAVSVAQEPRFV